MKLGVMKVVLQVPMAHSLKEKRAVVKSLKERLMSRFNVSVAEVADQDLHQRATLGLAFVALEAKTADAKLQKLEEFCETHDGAVVIDLEKEILHEE